MNKVTVVNLLNLYMLIPIFVIHEILTVYKLLKNINNEYIQYKNITEFDGFLHRWKAVEKVKKQAKSFLIINHIALYCDQAAISGGGDQGVKFQCVMRWNLDCHVL
ncbi:MAG TPA: hypothetical protein DCS30_10100 [Rhizobiales bacterium]|nr:hypothetical protein [Hyphomicrobiales bacterium]